MVKSGIGNFLMSKRQARNITKTYAQALTKDKFNFERVYLFGSQAKGKAGVFSDIDVAVVSKRPGRGKTYLSQKMKLWKATPLFTEWVLVWEKMC